jgi:hypothetical protein
VKASVLAWVARNRAVASPLKKNFEQFQGCNNDEEGGDNHEHGSNPMPYRRRMRSAASGATCGQ